MNSIKKSAKKFTSKIVSRLVLLNVAEVIEKNRWIQKKIKDSRI